MPLYEYECQKCGSRFEKIEPHSASVIKKCPKCGARAERLLAAPAVQFKGSGWYATDYASKSGASSEKSESVEKSEKTEKTESKPTESKEKKESKKDHKHK